MVVMNVLSRFRGRRGTNEKSKAVGKECLINVENKSNTPDDCYQSDEYD